MSNINIHQEKDDSQQKLWEYELQRFKASGQCPLCNGYHGNDTMCQFNPLDGGII